MTGTQPWPQKSGDEIVAELNQIRRLMENGDWRPAGVVVLAGKTAYSAIRQVFSEDNEILQVKECDDIGECEVAIIKNEGLFCHTNALRQGIKATWTLQTDRKFGSSDSSVFGQPFPLPG